MSKPTSLNESCHSVIFVTPVMPNDKTYIEIDGMVMRQVTSVEIIAAANEPTRVVMEFMANIVPPTGTEEVGKGSMSDNDDDDPWREHGIPDIQHSQE